MINKLTALLLNVKANYEYRGKVRETIVELNKLSNRELNDIGLCRGDIYSLAHSSYTKPNKITADYIEKVSPGVSMVSNANLRGWT
jgi:uncharacterized protein YjiS (DUF1127 family)|tara:strand:+ start:357 stop:614 length:258 start_codon:yes stop_codon:yes gene_type:complete